MGIGTASPTAKLHTFGTVRLEGLTGTGGFVAIDALGNLSKADPLAGIIKGVIGSTGNVVSGTGFTVTHPFTGVYQVTFTTPPAATPVINVTGEPSLTTYTTQPAYCTTSYTSGTCAAFGDYINVVSTTGGVTNINNANTNCSAGSYGNYLATSAQVTAGSTITLNVTVNIPGGFDPEGLGVWIDYNNNGQFETSEFVASSAPSTVANRTMNITIPTTSPNGNLGMRLRVGYSYAFGGTEGCGAIGTWGETEDYTIKVTGSTGATTIPNVLNATNTGFTVRVMTPKDVLTDTKLYFTAVQP